MRAHPHYEDQTAGDSGSGERKRREPAPPRRGDIGLWRWRGNCLLRQENNVAAIRALRQMREALLALLLGQRAFHEGAEPIGVGMRSGMVALGHDRS
jgi:hypothetical protein